MHLFTETVLVSIGPKPQAHNCGARVTNQMLRNSFVSTRDHQQQCLPIQHFQALTMT